MVTRAETLSAGDRVLVEWGLEEVEALVVTVYGSGSDRHVVVEVPYHDAQGGVLGYSTASVPVSHIRDVRAKTG